MYVIAKDKNGVRGYDFARALGVTKKTATITDFRIGLAMLDDSAEPYGGEL